MYRKLVLCCVLTLAMGCSQKDGDAKKTDESAKTEGSQAAAPAAALELGGLGLTGDAPAGTKVRKMGKKVMVQGAGLVATVGAAGRFDAADAAAANKEANSNKGTNIKSETLADGFLLTYENKGSAGSNYGVVSRRTIDGKAYACGTTVSSADQQANAAKFCKSLKKK
jgi:hypothetical protein